MTSIDASMKAASDIYEKGVYKSRVIRKCSSYWLNHGTLPKSLQGCHQKTKSFIDDEDVIEQSLNFVRKNGNKVTPCKYKDFVNKIAEFMKGSLDYLIDCYGYIDGLETYGILIYGNTIRIFTMDLVYDGLYRFNLTSKILLPTENANFLTIITVVSTLYSLLERIKSTVVVINSNSPQHLL
ncbi:679_t:CDS:2, partial [Entrophospora sp. SA101]